MTEFPKDFLWGAATSSHQVEGNNTNNDWWQWEQMGLAKEVSGEACRHYHLYREDFNLAKQLGHNAHRLSIEWSRIQPQEHVFSCEEIRHYSEVILCLEELGLEPIVTLHHFTNPLWFSRLGGWENKKAADYFLGYVEPIVEAFCGKIKFWVTINEPMVYIYHAYILGAWPPQQRSFLKARKVQENLTKAHLRVYRLIHDIYKKRNLPPPLVSIAKNMQSFVTCGSSLRNKIATYVRDRCFNFGLIEKLIRHKAVDFIGVNYYSRQLVEVRGWRFKNLLLDTCEEEQGRLKRNSLGWDIYPQGLYTLLLRLKKYGLPIFILENGICTEDDGCRWDFIREHLKAIQRSQEAGVSVLGYLYWSLIDNFEWDKGFAPRFGLIEIDYNNYQRKIRESAKKLSLVCKNNRLDDK